MMSKRLEELNGEREPLERALAHLKGTIQRRPGRPRGTKAKAAVNTAPKRRGRRGVRAKQAVGLVEKTPGIGAADIAKKLKIKPNYLYRVLGNLEKEGRVSKKGRQYFPIGATVA